MESAYFAIKQSVLGRRVLRAVKRGRRSYSALRVWNTW